MKGYRAILFLLIYAAFITSTAFVPHSCDESCNSLTATHTDFEDNGTPPPYGCTEEEVLNKTVSEHRHVSTMRLATRTNGNPAIQTTAITPADVHPGDDYTAHVTHPSVPIYIRHCNYRL
jgi:hypothetical protein